MWPWDIFVDDPQLVPLKEADHKVEVPTIHDSGRMSASLQSLDVNRRIGSGEHSPRATTQQLHVALVGGLIDGGRLIGASEMTYGHRLQGVNIFILMAFDAARRMDVLYPSVEESAPLCLAGTEGSLKVAQ